jgi:drug/metabolite transporter (DMT)-like permease
LPTLAVEESDRSRSVDFGSYAGAMPNQGRATEPVAVLALVLVTAIWGSTFFLIKDVVTRIPVADMLAVRFALATVALAAIVGRHLRLTPKLLRQGCGLGLLYGTAQILQTVGLAHTAASVSGFITGLYVVATPLLAALILKARIPAATWAAVGLATVGLGVLSLHGFAIGYGEMLTLVSAVVYAGHIVALGQASTATNVLSLSLVQLAVITMICAVAAVLPGSGAGLQLPASGSDWLVVGYLGLVAGAVTMALQTAAQTRIEPSRAAVVMAMEPVWAASFAVAVGGESVTVRMVIGGLAILAAMYLVELAPARNAWARSAAG